jgi:hypothetical protein
VKKNVLQKNALKPAQVVEVRTFTVSSSIYLCFSVAYVIFYNNHLILFPRRFDRLSDFAFVPFVFEDPLPNK